MSPMGASMSQPLGNSCANTLNFLSDATFLSLTPSREQYPLNCLYPTIGLQTNDFYWRCEYAENSRLLSAVPLGVKSYTHLLFLQIFFLTKGLI